MNIENIPLDLIVRGVRRGIRWIRRRRGREIANFVINFPKTGYVERIADVEKLARELSRLDDHAPRVVEIRDLGGSGKSWLTWNFFQGLKAHRLRFKFRIWFSFYKLENTIDPFMHFLDWTLQGLDPSFYKYRDSNMDAKSSKLLEILQQTRSLLVLDGLEITQNASLHDLGRLKDRCFRAFLCAACNFTRSRVIVTTRLKLTDICGKQGHAEFHMSKWSVSEFREFLSPHAPTPSLEVTQKVIKTLGSHPLSLAVFRYSLLTYHNGDFSLTDETLGEILSIKRTGKSKFEQ
ncbi:MAG: NB-ARC domain-containing protein, partial [Planctomycetota bacterium]